MEKMSMIQKLLQFALVWIVLACPLLSEENTQTREIEKSPTQIRHEITVTATRIDTPTREIASSVTVITRQDIELSQKTTVLEILQDVLGLTVVQNGPAGAAASVHIRGGNAEHTLVMMDGVEINDPITPSRSIDLAHCSLDNVERIEILRGPQSTLYGSDALSGLINIITRKGEGKPSVDFSARGGSYGTFIGNTAFSGSTGKISYSLGASYSQSEGFSAASQAYEGNTEKDGYHNLTVSGRLAFRLSDTIDFDLITRRVETEIDIDNFGGEFGDDPNHLQTYDSLFLKGQARLQLWNNRWEQKLSLALTSYDRSYENPTDSFHPFDSENASYKSSLIKLDWQHNLYLHTTNTLTFGLDLQQERGESKYISEGQWGPFESLFPLQKAGTTGLYIQDQIRFSGRLFVSLSIRLDSHSQFGDSLTYRLAPAYFIEKSGTKIKGTIGTGFKSPSLYQLYAPGTFWGPIGNSDLEPEKSTGWDFGIEQRFFQGKFKLGLTYFSHIYKNLIEFDYLLGYINISQAESQGVEFQIEVSPIESVSLQAGYTRLHATDNETGDALLRRPKDHFQTKLSLQSLKRFQMNLSWILIGLRDDMEYIGYSSQRVKMPSFSLVNATASYETFSNLQIFLRLDNVFNTTYEMIKGFGTPGFSLQGGFNIHF
jgi:vitamin B12 transporter